MSENLVVCSKCGGINRLPPARPPLEAKCGKCGAELFNGHPEDVNEQCRLFRFYGIGRCLLKPVDGGGEISFTEIDIARVRLIRDLQGDLGVNDEGVGVVLHLIDQLYSIRRSLMTR